MPTRKPGNEAGHFHAVRFYEDAQSLAQMVATFAAEGFIAGFPAIVMLSSEGSAAPVKPRVRGVNVS